MNPSRLEPSPELHALFSSSGTTVTSLLGEVHGDEPSIPAKGPGQKVANILATAKGTLGVRRTPPGCSETLFGRSPGMALGAVGHGGSVYHVTVAQS